MLDQLIQNFDFIQVLIKSASSPFFVGLGAIVSYLKIRKSDREADAALLEKITTKVVTNVLQNLRDEEEKTHQMLVIIDNKLDRITSKQDTIENRVIDTQSKVTQNGEILINTISKRIQF